MWQLRSLPALIALSACSELGYDLPPTAQAPRECFSVSLVQGYSSVDRNTVRLDLGPGSAFDVDISGPGCDQIEWLHSVAVEATTSSWICVGNAAGQGNLLFRDPTTQQSTSCYIEAVRPASGFADQQGNDP